MMHADFFTVAMRWFCTTMRRTIKRCRSVRRCGTPGGAPSLCFVFLVMFCPFRSTIYSTCASPIMQSHCQNSECAVCCHVETSYGACSRPILTLVAIYSHNRNSTLESILQHPKVKESWPYMTPITAPRSGFGDSQTGHKWCSKCRRTQSLLLHL